MVQPVPLTPKVEESSQKCEHGQSPLLFEERVRVRGNMRL
jgi:hypothetical protein